jgi:methionine-rich copper-binding protein CopC
MGQEVRARRFLASLVLVASGLLISSPAQALDLVEADPVVNSTIKNAPSAITLKLSGEIVESGSSMSVRAPSGKLVDDGSLLIDGAQALIGLGELSEAGRYTVAYQFMGIDGELLSGSYIFTFDAPAVVTTPTANPSESASSSEGEAGAAGATGGSSLATDIFMISLLVISFVVLIFIARSLRNPKPKKRKKK